MVSKNMKVQSQPLVSDHERTFNVPQKNTSRSAHSIKKVKAAAISNYGPSVGERPILSQTFYLPFVKLSTMTSTTGASSARPASKDHRSDNSLDHLTVLDFAKKLPQRNLSATTKKPAQFKEAIIRDVSIRSSHLESSSQGSRRVI